MKRIIIAFAAAAALALASCSGTKNCLPPQLDIPVDPVDADSAAIADLDWWQVYTDSSLVRIIRETLEHNRDFLAAAARVEEVRSLYGVTKADMWPTLSINAYADHETNHYAGENYKKDPEFGLKAGLSWEIDLWGKLRRARNRDAATYQATEADRRAMRITLIAEAASAYYRLLALDNELQIVRRSLATRLENVRMARLRFEGGVTSELVYRQAIVEASSTASLVPDLERRIEQAENAILALQGRFPGSHVPRGQLWVEGEMPDSVPVGLPSTLLRRRPDLKAAELRMRAALAQVGVNYADRFPSLTISLSAGLENDHLPTILSSPFTYAIGQLAGPLFDFGRRRRRWQASVAAYDAARFRFEGAVITAFGEVADAAAAFRRSREATVLKRELREAALKYVDLATIQYRAGAIAYIDVLDAQRRFFDAQIALSNAVRDERLALVDIYKALGGGFKE